MKSICYGKDFAHIDHCREGILHEFLREGSELSVSMLLGRDVVEKVCEVCNLEDLVERDQTQVRGTGSAE